MWRWGMGMKREIEVKERARAKGFMRTELIETIPEDSDSDMVVVVESSVGRDQSFDGDE